VWRCVSRLENTGVFCDARTVREEDLKQAVIQAINELFENRSNFLKVLEKNIAQTLSNHLHDKLMKVEKELEMLQLSLIGLANSNKDYNDVVDNIYKRREEKQQLQLEVAEQENGRERLNEIAELLKKQTCELEMYDDQLVRRMVKKMTVHSQKLEIDFKSNVIGEI